MSAADWVVIESPRLHAAVDPLGAQLSILREAGGCDLLWDGDPAVWKGRAPLLFPIVGELAGGCYRLGSAVYPLGRHGFARNRRFAVSSASRSAAEFQLAADASTLAVYPFDFSLSVRFELLEAELRLDTTIRNAGDAPMPASFGYHPALRWPLPFGAARSDHFIEFDADETEPVRRLDFRGLLTPERHPSPLSGRRLALVDSLFEDDALIFDRLRSRGVLYGAARGPVLRLSFPDTPYLGVWSKPGAHFVCIEPWHGLADPEGFAGDFSEKPGIFLLAPGASKTLSMRIALLPALPAH